MGYNFNVINDIYIPCNPFIRAFGGGVWNKDMNRYFFFGEEAGLWGNGEGGGGEWAWECNGVIIPLIFYYVLMNRFCIICMICNCNKPSLFLVLIAFDSLPLSSSSSSSPFTTET